MSETAIDLDLQRACHGVTPVLGALRLQVKSGETVAISGASGVGKTTLLRIVAGLHSNWQGHLAPMGRVAMVFQEPTLLPWRTALENITLTTGCNQTEAVAALQDVDLHDKVHAFPNTLSLGQQRRLSLARAFALRPQVLLMDEAFSSLDPDLSGQMMQLFQALCAQHAPATVLVTHDPAEATRLASRRLQLQGAPACFVASPRA